MEKLIPLIEAYGSMKGMSSGKGNKHDLMVVQYITKLIHYVGIAHYMHLNTRNYAEHKALDEFYKEMPELIDGFAEAFLATKPGLIIPPYIHGESYDNSTDMVASLKEGSDHMREMLSPEVVNKLDDVLSQVNATLYKLQFS